ncbi:unnamed protein product [Macrosiphum euphorbiae]|nr:unnamed protein product [Macrosiphum euphorbiae]
MGSKFKGFDGCFSMSINNSDSLRRLRNTNDRRKLLEMNIAKGTATRFDMMMQLNTELQIFDTFLKVVESKKKANKCCKVINTVISTLTKRINNMWNTVFLLFTVDDDMEPKFIKVSNSIVSI